MTTRILFLCTGNSCRSQMAEGWARHLRSGTVTPCSAGMIAKGLNPLAVRAMSEAGVDISSQISKTLDDALAEITGAGNELDHVVTVCGNAHETCPVFPGNTMVTHVGFDDPPALAQGAKTEEEAMVHYRRVRDEIRAFVETLPDALLR